MINQKPYDKLLQYGLRLFTKKRYTFLETQKKLLQYAKKRDEIDENLVPRILERLEELGYLDDERFVKDYILYCSRVRPRGRILIERELKRRGLPNNLIDTGLSENTLDEENMAFELLETRKKRWVKFTIYEQKSKAYRFLYSRGFHTDAIYKALEQCYNRG